MPGKEIGADNKNDYILEGQTIASITYNDLVTHTSADTRSLMGSSYQVQPTFLGLNQGLFTFTANNDQNPEVQVVQLDNAIYFSCTCPNPKTHLCPHQAQVLQAIMLRPELRVFFDGKLRRDKIKSVAQDYGLDKEENLDTYFDLEYAQRTVTIKSRMKELLPINAETQAYLDEALLLKTKVPALSRNTPKENTRLIVVLTEHKYYKHLYVQLYQATVSQEGKIKNPLQEILPADLIWLTNNPEEIKFYSAVSKFQQNYQTTPAESDGDALQALVKNPLQLTFYRQNLKKTTGTITAGSLVPVQVQNLPVNLELHVHLLDNFYQITGSITLEDQKLELPKLEILHEHFVPFKNKLYFIQNPDVLRVVRFF